MTLEKIQALQDDYNEWCALVPILEQSFAQWQRAGELAQRLARFYTTPEWLELHENFNQELDTQGNFSILSEDGLWNSLDEQRQRTMKLLKLAVKLLDSTAD
ncbi:hypothetical protein A4G19_07545 [Pasteurellaceae bacterium Macca]|nr:hypothetical protein [Pasteurellaceae bacterium Macca]